MISTTPGEWSRCSGWLSGLAAMSEIARGSDADNKAFSREVAADPQRPTAGCGCSVIRDCGWVLDEDSPQWPTVCALRRHVLRCPESTRPPGARSKQAFELNGGSGTHADAPAHFVPGGRTIDLLRPEELVGVPLAVVDVEAACQLDHDHAVSQSELEADEALHGPIAPGSLVCVRTGWSRRYLEGRAELAARRGQSQEMPHLGAAVGTGAQANGNGGLGPAFTRYHNATRVDDVHPEYGVPRMHFPGLTPSAAAWLVRERCAVGVGIDTMSPDPGASEGFGVHHAVLAADRYILENLNLEGLPPRGALATVAPLALQGAPEAPARVFAVLPQAALPSGGAAAAERRQSGVDRGRSRSR